MTENCHEGLKRVEDIAEERDKRYEVEFRSLRTELKAASDNVAVAMAAAEKAIVKAEAASEKRFESQNEFRQQMGDMQATYARTDLVDNRFATVEKKIDELTGFRTGTIAKGEARSEGFGFIQATVVALATIAGAFVTWLATRGP